MGFKFEDDNDEITLSGSAEKPSNKEAPPLPKPGKLPIPGKPKIKPTVKEETTEKPKVTPPKPISRAETEITEEYIEVEYSRPYEEEPEGIKTPLAAKSKPTVFDENFGEEKPNPEAINANYFFAEKEPSPVKFIRPEEAKRRKEFTKQITIIRASVVTAVAIILVAGIASFIPRPTFSESPKEVNYAITESNRYTAAATAVENYALQFVHDFMDRTENAEPERRDLMIKYLSPTAYSAINNDLPSISNNSGQNVQVYQRITSGPYIYRTENITTEAINAQSAEAGGYLSSFIIRVQVQKYVTGADFTVTRPILDSDGVETGEFETVTETPTFEKEWVYISVPVVYSRTENEITLYGYPAFVAEPKTENLEDYELPFKNADWTRADDALMSSQVLKAQLESFMVAWSEQNPNLAVTGELAATLAQDATVRAKEGLNSKFVAPPETGEIVQRYSVEALPADYEPTGRETRKALLNVTWASALDVEQETIVPYRQQYIVSFRGNDADGYKIIDIKTRYAE